MATEARLTRAIENLWLRPDIVWLATRLRSDLADEEGSWPQRINIHIRFFRALMAAGCGNGVRVDVASHRRSGYARPRYVRRRVFLEWDINAESTSQDGVWTSFAIFALIPVQDDPWLWCWICDSIEEEEYAEAVFRWLEPQSFAFATGSPLFPERISLGDEN